MIDFSCVCAIYRFTDVPEEQEVPVDHDIQEEKIYDDLCSLKSKAGSQVSTMLVAIIHQIMSSIPTFMLLSVLFFI